MSEHDDVTQLGTLLKEIFGDNLKNFQLQEVSNPILMQSFGGGPAVHMQATPSTITLQINLYMTSKDFNNIDYKDLGPHSVCISQHFSTQMSTIPMVQEMTSTFRITNLRDFIGSIKDRAWQRYNESISRQIDAVINDDND